MLGGAASNRHYYRLYHSLSADSGAVIGVIGENAKENHAFLALGRHMTALGLPVPKILVKSPSLFSRGVVSISAVPLS